VYGGGGIDPDVVFAQPTPAPLWLARTREEDLPTKWIGGYLTANAAAFTTPEALAANPRLPADALASFRTFAAGQGVQIPADAESAEVLNRSLVRAVAGTKWGAEGYYRVVAALDPDVAAAVREFGRAASILGPAQ
jgi:carboxyl-terminal processing protease